MYLFFHKFQIQTKVDITYNMVSRFCRETHVLVGVRH